MAALVAVLGLVAVGRLGLYLVFRASARVHVGREEYLPLRMIQGVAGMLLARQLINIGTVLMLYYDVDRLDLWLVVAVGVVGIEAVSIAGILFELLGGSVKRRLHAIWQWIGDYLEE